MIQEVDIDTIPSVNKIYYNSYYTLDDLHSYQDSLQYNTLLSSGMLNLYTNFRKKNNGIYLSQEDLIAKVIHWDEDFITIQYDDSDEILNYLFDIIDYNIFKASIISEMKIIEKGNINHVTFNNLLGFVLTNTDCNMSYYNFIMEYTNNGGMLNGYI